jgi:hypothetical protein
VPRHDGAARGFFERMAGEAQYAAAVDERHDDVAADALHVGHFGPDDAEIERAVKLHPATRQFQVTDLVAAAATEADRCEEVAAVVRRQPIQPREDGQPVSSDTLGEVDGLQGHPDLVKLFQDVFLSKIELARPLHEALQIGPSRLAADCAHLVTEDPEPTGRCCGCRFGCHGVAASVLDLAIQRAETPCCLSMRKIVALPFTGSAVGIARISS